MTKEELLASLTATADRDAIDFDPNDGAAPYIDWSSDHDGYENGRHFEFGADGEAVMFGLTWAEIERLQRALTVLLLERP